MSRCTEGFLMSGSFGEGGGIEVRGGEPIPDVVDGDRRGVQHVVSIETIVAQVVQEKFVSGEIMQSRHLSYVRGGVGDRLF